MTRTDQWAMKGNEICNFQTKVSKRECKFAVFSLPLCVVVETHGKQLELLSRQVEDSNLQSQIGLIRASKK